MCVLCMCVCVCVLYVQNMNTWSDSNIRRRFKFIGRLDNPNEMQPKIGSMVAAAVEKWS